MSANHKGLIFGCLLAGGVLALVVGVVVIAGVAVFMADGPTLPSASHRYYQVRLAGYSAKEVEALLFDEIPSLSYNEIDSWGVTSQNGFADIALTPTPGVSKEEFDKSAQLAIRELIVRLPSGAALVSGDSRGNYGIAYEVAEPAMEPHLEIKLDREKLTEYGLDVGDVTETLSREGIFDRSLEESDDLRNFLLRAPDGTNVPLEEVADFTISTEPTILQRSWPEKR